MTKKETEPIIRNLCHDWFAESDLTPAQREHPSFTTFKSWLDSKGYSYLLRFRSVAGADEDAELWFDQELKQTWRR